MELDTDEKTRRIAVIGKGTAGSQSLIYFANKISDNTEIDWYFDPDKPPVAVGEGSALEFPINLYVSMGFSHLDLKNIDGTFKAGIEKTGWGKGDYFFHDFPPPSLSYHFNANKLQDYIYDKFKSHPNITIHKKNVNSKDVDADFVMDCSGKPESYEDFYESRFIPVNSVHVTQCYWDGPKFQHSLNIARPYGWVFGIPLQNRCSIGYLYNNKINTLEDIKEDVKEVFKQYNLTPSDHTNSFSFNNYWRKCNQSGGPSYSNASAGRIVYNGNTSFFLEPLEATSFSVMNLIYQTAERMWANQMDGSEVEDQYQKFMRETETMIMMHYYSGSQWDTDFWKMAQEKAEFCMHEALTSDNLFKGMLDGARQMHHFGDAATHHMNNVKYGPWWIGAFYQNMKGLNIMGLGRSNA